MKRTLLLFLLTKTARAVVYIITISCRHCWWQRKREREKKKIITVAFYEDVQAPDAFNTTGKMRKRGRKA